MAEIVKKAIEAGGQAPGVANSVKHLKSDIVMNLKEKNREIYGMTIQKDGNTDAGKETLWKVVQRVRFERQVFLTHSRSHRIC